MTGPEAVAFVTKLNGEVDTDAVKNGTVNLSTYESCHRSIISPFTFETQSGYFHIRWCGYLVFNSRDVREVETPSSILAEIRAKLLNLSRELASTEGTLARLDGTESR